MNEIVLATDLGGTNLRMSAIDRDGAILYRTKRETPKSESAHEIVIAIRKSAQECIEAVGNGGKVKAIAAAVPGIVKSDKGIILKAPNVPALDGFRMAAALESEMNLPCLLENDANAAAVGERWQGASKGFDNSICVTLGTGVGGGIIIDGKVLRGVDGTAGEIGHIGVEPFGAPCGCGSRGCVEQYASATAIVRLTRELGSQYPKSELPEKVHLSSLEIYEAGKLGDELALEVFRKQGFYLGIALAGLVNVLNPEVIVIGGGAAAGWDLFIPQTRLVVQQRAYREPAERAKIVRAECGDDAGILGVARLAFESVAVLV
ncbi:MAG: ROK family protein [Pyrinomonadaceae bacterium]